MRVDDRRLGRNDDRQVRDGHPRAIEDQTLGRVSAGRTSEGVTLNAAYRRPIGANFRQEQSRRCTPNISYLPLGPLKPILRPGEMALYRCGSLLGRGSEPLRPGKKRVGPKYWGRLVRLAEAQKS